MKHLLYTIFLCIFCCSSMSVLAQIGNDNEGDPPPINPPKKNSEVPMSVVPQTLNSFEVIFLNEAEDAQLEVCRTDGTPVFIATGTVSEISGIQLDTRRWKRGSYTVRLKVKGKPVNIRTIQLQ